VIRVDGIEAERPEFQAVNFKGARPIGFRLGVFEAAFDFG